MIINSYNPVSFRARVNQYSNPNNQNLNTNPQQRCSNSMKELPPASAANVSMVRFGKGNSAFTVLEITDKQCLPVTFGPFDSEAGEKLYNALKQHAKKFGDQAYLRFKSDDFEWGRLDPSVEKACKLIKIFLKEGKDFNGVQEIEFIKCKQGEDENNIDKLVYWHPERPRKEGVLIMQSEKVNNKTKKKELETALKEIGASKESKARTPNTFLNYLLVEDSAVNAFLTPLYKQAGGLKEILEFKKDKPKLEGMKLMSDDDTEELAKFLNGKLKEPIEAKDIRSRRDIDIERLQILRDGKARSLKELAQRTGTTREKLLEKAKTLAKEQAQQPEAGPSGSQ